MKSLPTEFLESMKHLLGDRFNDFLNAFNQPAQKGVVFNTSLKSVNEIKDLTQLDVDNVGFSDCCFKLDNYEKCGNTWFHHAGLIYLQEPSSMVAGAVMAKALSSVDNPLILDMCASPGGKTIDMFLNLNGYCKIIANEIIYSRAKILFSNIERLALEGIDVISNKPEEIAEECGEVFDGVLVDAPCSGEGMFRKDPLTINEWNAELPLKNQERQKAILCQAVRCLKPGGYLVYSTCTYNLHENEEVVLYAKSQLGLNIVSVSQDIEKVTEDGFVIDNTNELVRSRRLYIGGKLGEGQFVCLMQKPQIDTQNTAKECEKHKKCAKIEKFYSQQLEVANRFLQDTLVNFNGYQPIVKDNIVIFVKDMPYNLNYLSFGVRVGEVINGRIEPHHQFFKTMGYLFKNQYNLTSQEVEKFLAGEEIAVDNVNSGFCSCFFRGVCLGGGKISNGRLKNYYPKGLRAKLKV